jgi:rhamnosyltransferase
MNLTNRGWMTMNRILFFVHYNKYNELLEYVLYLLKNIKSIYKRIVFISNSLISDAQHKEITALCDKIMIRENKGFDFGAWKEALLQEGWDNLSQYDNLTLMNDTCFGPLFDMEKIYLNMECQKIDFWGLTEHQASEKEMSWTNVCIPKHLQSYFICLNNAVIKSEVFKGFWETLTYQQTAEKTIEKHETRLTKKLTQAGFKYSVLFSLPVKNDISVMNPDLCIKNGVPLVKIKAFIFYTVTPKYTIKLIQEKTNYPASIIYNYFLHMCNPNISLVIDNKIIPAHLDLEKIVISLKAAIHLHVFYLDVFERYISYLDSLPVQYDLFITTDTSEKRRYIENCIRHHKFEERIKEIFITPNKGRDILPWLTIKDHINSYDIVGHFHTKKAITEDEWVGILWQQEIFDLLLNSVNLILKTFSLNPNIGVIIPDIPLYFRNHPLRFFEEKDMHTMMQKLWQKTGCKKNIIFSDLLSVIMPYGTMFWYRPAALRPLFQLDLTTEDIPAEPLIDNGTIIHCIERLIVYIAWNEGYDYRIIVNDKPFFSGFEDNVFFSKKYSNLKNSKSYNVGKFVLALPRAIKHSLRKAIAALSRL